LSIVQMPAGVPVATVAIGEAGAKNAGLLAAQLLGMTDKAIAAQLDEYRIVMRKAVEATSDLAGLRS
ncbi:MAG: AIR carboxylase family protein, partial [Culicoidibacterales bacterium]